MSIRMSAFTSQSLSRSKTKGVLTTEMSENSMEEEVLEHHKSQLTHENTAVTSSYITIESIQLLGLN